MKIITGLIAGLLIGSVAGWYAGYSRPAAKENRDVRQFFTTMEWDDSKAANFALKAIPVVESGDKQKAIHLLALPIGGWYRVYADKAGTNEERLRLRAKIEQLASSNSIVDAEIRRKLE
jgi:hypothetical protein